jgi:hypothetical protein
VGNRRGVAAGIVAAGLGVLAAQPLAGSAAVLPLAEAVPQFTVPSVTVPSVTVPSVTVPSVSIPVATTPPVTTPEVTTPSVTSPSATVPSVSVPSATTPRVSTPVGTVPSVTTPKRVAAPSTTGQVRTTSSQVSGAVGAGAAGGSGATGTANGVSSASQTANELRGTGASGARPRSPRALRLAAAHENLAAAHENRRLRRLVGRLRGCLGTLDAGPRRLLTLRAGLHGRPQSATATARILHISLQREDRLERLAVTALARRTGENCAGSALLSSSSDTGRTSTMSSSSSADVAPSGVRASPSAVRASRSPQSRHKANLSVSPSRARTERAATGTSFPGAILTALLGLLLATAIVVVPRLRRQRAHPALVGAAASRDRPPAQAASPSPSPFPSPSPSPPPGSGTGGTARAQSAAILRALRRRTVTRMDPAIAPMAADVFERMAGDGDRVADPDDPDEGRPERDEADAGEA